MDSKIRTLINKLKNPATGASLLTPSWVQHISHEEGVVRLMIELPASEIHRAEVIKEILEEKISKVRHVRKVEVLITVHRSSHKKTQLEKKIDLPQIKNIIAVSSGKGGVGKSMVAVNLAYALAQMGAEVGLLDLDVYGPSIPLMLGLNQRPENEEGKLQPLKYGPLKCISMGMMIPPEKAVIWRGPLVQLAVQQLLRDVAWGELDYLILDTPPGTGDVHLTLAQTVDLTGAIIVTTPQELALIDARKGIAMYETVKVPVLGVVENMSTYKCGHCGKETALFAKAGGLEESMKRNIPLLAQIPFDLKIRESADTGVPIAQAEPYKSLFTTIAQALLKLKN